MRVVADWAQISVLGPEKNFDRGVGMSVELWRLVEGKGSLGVA